jgi:hypothetical protein
MKRRIAQVTLLLALAILAIAGSAFLHRSDVRASSKLVPDFDSNNSVVNDGKGNNQLMLAETGNYSGQSWKITKVK